MTAYEGEVAGYGSNVIIRTVPTVSVYNYVIGAGLTRQRPTSPSVTLSINRAKAFSVAVSRVQYRQADVDISEIFATDGAQQIKIAADQDLNANIFTQVSAQNQGNAAGAKSANLALGAPGAPLTVNSASITTAITSCSQVLDEQNVPDEERWILLPAAAVTAAKRSPLSQAYLTGDAVSIIRNGKIGTIDRFTCYQTNNLLQTTDTSAGTPVCWNVIFGHKSGIAWASQIAELREVEDPNDFGTLIDGLLVYGYQIVNPSVIGWAFWNVGVT